MKSNNTKVSRFFIAAISVVTLLAVSGCQCSKKEEAPAAVEDVVPADDLNAESAPAEGTEAAPADAPTGEAAPAEATAK
jgi:hypothetical protein